MKSVNLSRNLKALRQYNRFSLEEVAGRIGVSRQAVGKWENGESTPDIANCAALAELYGVTLDALVRHSQEDTGLPIPPEGRHMFGVVTMGERGQIVIPTKAREIFRLSPGDTLLVLGDERVGSRGLALVDPQVFFAQMDQALGHRKGGDT